MNGISIKEGSSVVESHKAIPPGIIYHHIISYHIYHLLPLWFPASRYTYNARLSCPIAIFTNEHHVFQDPAGLCGQYA